MTPVASGGALSEHGESKGKLFGGDVSERPKVPLSKSGRGQPLAGSNPAVTATAKALNLDRGIGAFGVSAATAR